MANHRLNYLFSPGYENLYMEGVFITARDRKEFRPLKNTQLTHFKDDSINGSGMARDR